MSLNINESIKNPNSYELFVKLFSLYNTILVEHILNVKKSIQFYTNFQKSKFILISVIISNTII